MLGSPASRSIGRLADRLVGPVLALAVTVALLPTDPAAPAAAAPSALVSSTTVTAGASATAADDDPRLTRPIAVNIDSQSWRLSRDDASLRPIGSTPQARWVLPGEMPLPTVRRQVSAYAATARAAGRIPLMSIYAIPNRDCGGHSAGGLSNADYRTWSTRVAEGLRGRRAIVVLEPDALASRSPCPDQMLDRPALLSHAVRELDRNGVWTYLDAGHSDWVPAAQMAQRLKDAGVQWARGFSVNVSTVGGDPRRAPLRPSDQDRAGQAGRGRHEVRDRHLAQRRRSPRGQRVVQPVGGPAGREAAPDRPRGSGPAAVGEVAGRVRRAVRGRTAGRTLVRLLRPDADREVAAAPREPVRRARARAAEGH